MGYFVREESAYQAHYCDQEPLIWLLHNWRWFLFFGCTYKAINSTDVRFVSLDYLALNNLLAVDQFGFRRGRSSFNSVYGRGTKEHGQRFGKWCSIQWCKKSIWYCRSCHYVKKAKDHRSNQHWSGLVRFLPLFTISENSYWTGFVFY